MAQGPFKLVGGIAKGHPNDQDLEDAVEFYKGIIRRFDTVIGQRREACYFANYEQQQLPVTRQEFENRSMLYHILEDMKAFLDIKKDFITAR